MPDDERVEKLIEINSLISSHDVGEHDYNQSIAGNVLADDNTRASLAGTTVYYLSYTGFTASIRKLIDYDFNNLAYVNITDYDSNNLDYGKSTDHDSRTLAYFGIIGSIYVKQGCCNEWNNPKNRQGMNLKTVEHNGTNVQQYGHVLNFEAQIRNDRHSHQHAIAYKNNYSQRMGD